MQVTALERSTPRTIAAAEPRPRSLLVRRAIWRDALLAWAVQHVALIAVTWLAVRPASMRQWIAPWTNWDGQPFVQIATNGYVHPAQAAFYPLYALVERLIATPTGLEPAVAGVLIANVAALVAFALLRALAERELGRESARRALVYLLVFPTAFFLAAAYSESLFLLLSLAAFLALRSHRWPLAGALIALAALTRPVGILLLAAVAAEAWTSSPRLRRVVRNPRAFLTSLHATPPYFPLAASNLSTPPSTAETPVSSVATSLRLASAFLVPLFALAGYAAYIAARFGDPFGFVSTEGGTWQRGATWPWQSVGGVVGALLTDTVALRFHALVDLALLAFVLALAVHMARRLPPPYTLYTWATLALILLIPSRHVDGERENERQQREVYQRVEAERDGIRQQRGAAVPPRLPCRDW
jgi:hypothetical protein